MKILIISGDNYDDSEMLYPYYRMIEEGFSVTVAAAEKREICGKYHFKIAADISFDEINAADYDGLLLPGGTAPEKVRQVKSVIDCVRTFAEQKKPIASICHGQQILISAKVLEGIKATCYPGIKDDLINAGAIYLDEPVVVCDNFVTSRRPQDLPYFMREYIKKFEYENVAIKEKFYYHSRHIPEEQLNMEHPTGKRLKEELLCDVIEAEYAKRLKEYGFGVVETRLVWWELEKQPGVYDWSVLEKRISKLEQAGLEPAVFPWFMHAPEWENKLVRAKCLEDNENSSIISMWEPGLLEVYDRLYGALAKEYGDRIKFLYFSFYGDFGETQYLHNTAHYKFSSPHGHYGYWCGDKLARESFKSFLKNRYTSVAGLNEAWGTDITDWDSDLMPHMPFVSNSLKQRRDFQEWYTSSLLDFIDKVGAIIRKHFPDVRGGFPMGCDRERGNMGQIKSQVVKRITKKYNILVRWTAMGNERDFGIADFQARRVSSAEQFYSKCGFGTEASIGISPDLAYNSVYLNIANGSSLMHNEMGSVERGIDDYSEWIGKIPVLPAKSEIAVFYPVEGEQLECMTPERATAMPDGKDIGIDDMPGPDTQDLYENAGRLRKLCHYEVIDSFMVEDGVLDGIRDLILLCTCPVPQKIWEKLEKWVENGGRIWYKNDSEPWILESTEKISDITDVRKEASEAAGVYCVSEWPEFKPYSEIINKYKTGEAPVYVTSHESCYSVYMPDKKKIVFEDK